MAICLPRWRADGEFAGGLPGTRAAPGTRVEFGGADFFRFNAAGQVAEYWVTTEVFWLMAQLGAISGQ